MPWKPADALRHTKAADTPHKRQLWAKIANANLSKGEGPAIRIANSAIGKAKAKAKDNS